MHERRQSYRFRTTPGTEPILVTAREASADAHLLDTSASGLSIHIEGAWAPTVGEKVQVELAHDERVVCEVVRAVLDPTGTVIGLRRLSEAWDDSWTGESVPTAPIVKTTGLFGVGRAQIWLALLLMVLGLILGTVVWNWHSLVDSKGFTGNPPHKTPAVPGKPGHSATRADSPSILRSRG